MFWNISSTNLLCTTHGIRSWGDRGKDTGPACPQGPQPTLTDRGLYTDSAATEEHSTMGTQRRGPDVAWDREGSSQDACELNPEGQIGIHWSMVG